MILKSKLPKNSDIPVISKFGKLIKIDPTILPTPTTPTTSTPSPTPKPLTFAEMNDLYGPCVRLPVLYYHHIQLKTSAEQNNQLSLSVYTDIFKTQMEYLNSHGYRTISASELVDFFDNGAVIPPKSFMLTFDDGYANFYSDAYPILSGLGFKSVVFVSTGLMDNPGYLNWKEIDAMKELVHFGNHTWSHKSVLTQIPVMQKEIQTADNQLSEKGLNNPKIFAYPYGPENIAANNYLQTLNYKLAFTTKNGNIMCKKLRLSLPRIRVGNVSISRYGF